MSQECQEVENGAFRACSSLQNPVQDGYIVLSFRGQQLRVRSGIAQDLQMRPWDKAQMVSPLLFSQKSGVCMQASSSV